MDSENTPLKKKTSNSVQNPDLVEELIEEILSRVPAKSLLKFRCVSKSWRSLIGSKPFIKTHLHNISKSQSNTHRRILYNCTQHKHGLKHRSLQSYLDQPSLHPSLFDDPKNNHLTTPDAYIVDHCNGVLCMLKKPGRFFLWNPTTRISVELPELERVPVKCGFGWDEGSDAYKVFAVVSEREKSVGTVYSTKTNSWKIVEHGCLSVSLAKFASGKIHRLKEGGCHRHIETFDLNSEEFATMDIPCEPEVGGFMWLCEELTEGCFSVICQSNDNNDTRRIWVMKKYGVKESWVESTVVSCAKKRKLTCCKSTFSYFESLVSPE